MKCLMVVCLVASVFALLLVQSGCMRILPSRIAANEASAIANLRTIGSAQELYCTKYGNYTTLAQLAAPGIKMIDSALAQATTTQRPKAGYFYILRLSQTGYTCTARPAFWDETGTRNFRIDQSGAIYYNQVEQSINFTTFLGTTPLGRR